MEVATRDDDFNDSRLNVSLECNEEGHDERRTISSEDNFYQDLSQLTDENLGRGWSIFYLFSYISMYIL